MSRHEFNYNTSERSSIELQGNSSYIKVGMSGMIPQVLMESNSLNERKFELLWRFPRKDGIVLSKTFFKI